MSDSPRTTCVACLIQDGIAHWAHVGDSRLYLIRKGKVLARTRDHSRVQLLIDQGAISPAQAHTHPDRNKIYSCLGGPLDPKIELSHKTPLEAGDVVTLCTDGLWGLYTDEQLASALKNENLMKAVPALMEHADAHGGRSADNLSVVALRWEDDYVEQGSSDVSIIETQTMQLGAFTTRLDKFGRNPKYKTELSDDEIERAIEEIRSTIQKYSK
ncbi:MAG: SpoIIE family protein phosphatase [Azoarcus sp.]|jgi:serine/threonine protein phosphatase PrpC|nr:SpoIIE family protein phosphatase [Azoarcus sp.]